MVISGRTINPGDLRTSVAIQMRTGTVNAGGFTSPVWSTAATVWARWENVHGSEAWAAQSIGAQQAATVLIRYRSGIDTTCALLLGSVRYEIVSVDDIGNRHEFIELKVKRMGSG